MKLLPSDHLTCRDTVILIVLSFLIIVLPFAYYHGSFDDANVCHRSLLLDDVMSLLFIGCYCYWIDGTACGGSGHYVTCCNPL